MYTKREAKADGILLWEYFRDNPWVATKHEASILAQLQHIMGACFNSCPLCEYYYGKLPADSKKTLCSLGCPLVDCTRKRSPYEKWCSSETDADRAKYASIIVERIKAW